MTPEQEAEAIQIELELRKRSNQKVVADATDKSVQVVVPDEAVISWEKASPSDRFKLLLGRVFSPSGMSAFTKNAKEVANAPINLALEAGGPAAGQAAGASMGPLAPVAVPVLGAVGGAVGDAAAQMRSDEPFSVGRMVGAAIGGAVPGASLSKAGVKQVAREGAKYALTGALAKTAESEIDRGELPSSGEIVTSAALGAVGAPMARVLSKAGTSSAEDLLYSQRNSVLKSLQNEGVVVPPHEIGKGGTMLSSVAGKEALQAQTAQKNQFVWQKLARDEIGLSKEALPISVKDLEGVRAKYAKPYQELQSISEDARQQLEDQLKAIARESDPHAAMIQLDEPATKEAIGVLGTLASADVDALKKARYDAQRAFDSFRAGNPTAYDEWISKRDLAESLEAKIEQAASLVEDKTLLPRLKEARKKIAQTYSIQDALNRGNGLVDPVYFGRQLDRGESLSGNLKKIAQFQLAFNREAVEAGRTGAPGVGSLWPMLAVNQASRGNAPGVIGAAVSATAGRPARAYLLSDFVQKGMLAPDEYQNFAAALARYLAENHPTSRKQSQENDRN